jgi:uncharacterized protein (DUF58 family)
MSANHSPQAVQAARPMPLLGFLCLMAGLGVFFSAGNVSHFAGDYRETVNFVGTAIGSVLILWGLRLIFLKLGNRPGRSVGRLNRNRVLLPLAGAVYLVIMIVAFVGSLYGKSNMLMLVFSIMAGPFIVNGGVAFSLLKRNILRRQIPARAMAGEVVSVGIVLENQKWWFSSWMMTVRDRVGHERLGREGSLDVVLDPMVLFASVRPNSERTARYQLRATKRGRYLFGPLEVATRFPLGLVERGFVTDVRGEMLVYPQIGTLTSSWHRQFQTATNFVERHDTSQGTFADEFHHLRDYLPGDNPRDIHWRTSARINNLTVRQFHQCRDRDLIVLVDLWQPTAPKPVDRDLVELALSLVATICMEHLRRSRGVNQSLFIAGNKATKWRSNRGAAGLESLMDLLAMVEAGNAADLVAQIEAAARVTASSSRTVLVTTRSDLLAALPNLPIGLVPGLEVLSVCSPDLTRYFSLESSYLGELEPVLATNAAV